MINGKQLNLRGGYINSIIQDIESYHTTELGLVRDDIRVVSDLFFSEFNFSEISPRINKFEDLSEVLVWNVQPCTEDRFDDAELSHSQGRFDALQSIDIEYVEIIMKINLFLHSGFIAISLDDKQSFKTILGFTTLWDYKNFIEYTS